MFRKFLHGLLFGTGFTIAAIIVMTVYANLRLASLTGWSGGTTEQSVATAPPIQSADRFLGSSGVYASDFLGNRQGVLAAGPGEIAGSATANGKPAPGLRLRLALNGSVYSQWAVTDQTGHYRIPVPYGDYRIDGYDLDSEYANAVLPNLITHPRQSHSRATFTVAADAPGRGLDLRFVAPVRTELAKRRFTAAEPVVVHWVAYPGASQYRIGLEERTDPDEWRSTEVFGFRDRPSVLSTEADLRALGANLKPGYFYAVRVEALDEQLQVLSQTPSLRRGSDFEIAE